MRILFFSSYFYPYLSGITTYPLKILSRLSKSNQVSVLTFKHKKGLVTSENLNGINIKRMNYNFTISKGFISLPSIIDFINSVRKSEVVILNIPNFEGLPLAIIARFFGKPIISIFHCQVFLGKGFFAKIVNLFLNLSVYTQLFLSKVIVAYTQTYVDSLPVGSIFKNKIRIVLPPVEKLPVDRKKLDALLKLKGKNIWLGYAGRIAKEKGLEYLIISIKNFLPAQTGKLNSPAQAGIKNLSIVFAGPFGKDVAGENEYYLKIKKMLDENKIPYHFLGNLSAGVLGAFYKAIDVMVLPSVNQTEAFGMVQVEAILLGTPVIASNLPGVNVPVTLSGMGELVEPANTNQLSSAIKKVLANRAKYTDYSLIERSRKIFDIKKTYQFYEDLLTYTPL